MPLAGRCARAELWYVPSSKDTPLDQIMRKTPGTQILYHCGFTTERGWYDLEATAGRWLVRICKGPEWEMSEFEVTVAAADAEGQRHDVALHQLYDLKSEGWYSGDLHHHSLYSDGWQRASEIYEAALAMDCDFVALSDHNTLSQTGEWLDFASDRFLPIPAFEVTTWQSPEQKLFQEGYGHQNAIGVGSLVHPRPAMQVAPKAEAHEPAKPAKSIWKQYHYESWEDVQQAIEETHRQGGLYVLNHPMGSDEGGSITTWGKIHDYDGIEVFNGGGVAPFLAPANATRGRFSPRTTTPLPRTPGLRCSAPGTRLWRRPVPIATTPRP